MSYDVMSVNRSLSAMHGEVVKLKLIEALKEAQYFIQAPAEDLKEGVLSRIREAIAKAEGRS